MHKNDSKQCNLKKQDHRSLSLKTICAYDVGDVSRRLGPSIIRSFNHGMGPAPVGVHCTLRDVLTCRSVFCCNIQFVYFGLASVCNIIYIHSLYGLSLLLISSVVSNTNAFSFLLSYSILQAGDQMWPNSCSFLCIARWSRSRLDFEPFTDFFIGFSLCPTEPQCLSAAVQVKF